LIIRTTIDRPKVSLQVFLLLQKKIISFDYLYFIINKTIKIINIVSNAGILEKKRKLTLDNIPKTIIFVNTQKTTRKTTAVVRSWLVLKS
jgi:hypothetical protein